MTQSAIRTAVRNALLASSAVGASLVTAPVVAQEQLEEIVITGSRITRSELDTTIPMVAIDSAQLASQGFENFADIATQLPQFAPSFGASRTQSTFSGVEFSGLNYANLRNLAGVRTLTLINGRRVPGGSSTSTAVDFNTLPTANIERIEVQTGGASAIYGADAVAGVVNIITKKGFEGLEVGASYGQSSDNDNINPGGYLMFGGLLGEGGHGLVTLQYDEQGRVSCANRALCSDDFLWLDPADPRRGPTARSGVPLGGRYFAGNASYTTRNGSITDAEGNLIPFVTSIDGYNRNAQRDLAIPTRRIMLAAEVDYPVAERASVFAELNYGEARIDSSFEAHPFQSQASGSLFGGGPGVDGLEATIPIDNPFVPQPLRDAVLAADPTATDITWWQRFAFFDNRGARSSRETVRAVAGLKGDLESIAGFGENWRWEVAHVWGQTKVDLGTEGLVSTGKLYYGLRVEPDPDNAGQFRCIDPGARATGCIPINPFNYTPEMIEALRLGASTEGTSELNDTVAWISGSAWQLPAGPLNVAAGLEYRSNSGYLNYDSIINQGLATGNQISDIDPVRVSTQEVFVEALVPVVRDLPFAQALDLEAAYRYSDTKDIDTYDTWKLGFAWVPVDSLRVRAMQARSVRTPIPGELSGTGQEFGVVQDPCTEARRNLNPTRAANCLADGVPADYNPGQIIEQSVAGLSGGNPDLAPEQGTTRTYGLVWTPSFAPALAISIDRFEIEIDDIITTVARQTAVNLCYDQRLFCDVVTRGTNPLLPGATYVLTDVNEQLQNVAKYDIRGIDLDARYAFDLGRWGALNLQLLMTFYDKAEQTPLPGEAAIDLLGKAGGDTSDQGYVKQTGNLSVGYDLGQFNANWTMRYIGSAEMAVGSRDAGFPDIGAKTYHSLRLGYAFKEGSEIYVGANNLFDEDPPLFCSGCSGTQALDTIPGYYDVFGLSYYAGMRYRF